MIEHNKEKVVQSDFINDVKEALIHQSTSHGNFILYFVALFFVVFFIWAALSSIDERTISEGKVIPSSQIKYIQSLEGGIIEEILVREGQKVKKNEVIIRLNNTFSLSNYREERARYLALQASIARLKAETQGQDKIDFPAELSQYTDLIRTETEFFNTRKNQMQNKLGVLKKTYELSQNEYKMTEPLVKQGVMSTIELLRLEKEMNEKKGAIEDFSKNFIQEAYVELTKKNAEFAALSESLVSKGDRVDRSILRSPVNGTVKKVNVSTLGQVIKPGENILEIVPDEDSLLIQARVSPTEIGFIHPGQAASVKITAYDFSVYGGLEGKVEYISADTITDERGHAPQGQPQSYYEVLIRTDKNYLGTPEKPLQIIPGMTASVYILTGEKTVLKYLMKPLIKAQSNALRER